MGEVLTEAGVPARGALDLAQPPEPGLATITVAELRHGFVHSVAHDRLHLLAQARHHGSCLLLHHRGDGLTQAQIELHVNALHHPVHQVLLKALGQLQGGPLR